MSTLRRIKKFIDYKGISVRAFELAVGFSNGAFASQLKNNRTIGVDKLENILHEFPELDANWLLTGKGQMILPKTEGTSINQSIKGNQNIMGDKNTYNSNLKERIDSLEKELKQKDKLINSLLDQQKILSEQISKLLNKL